MSGKSTIPLATRFWSKVDKTGECWIWTGAREKSGYGAFQVKKHVKQSAHRLAYELTFGSIPDGMFVCHRCDNPSCVRPEHLFLGKPVDNTHDMILKGRKPRGERTGTAKLTWAAVRDIRARYRPRTSSSALLAAEYGVDRTLIWLIATGKLWVEDETC